MKGADQMVGDTEGAAPRRDIKPRMNSDQQGSMAKAVDKFVKAHNAGSSTTQIAKDYPGSLYDIKELMGSTSDAVDLITTLVVHGSMRIELATFLGVSPAKKQTLEDVLAIQEASSLQALNISPKGCETLVRGLSRELVRKIDGVDYTAPVKAAQQTTPKFTTAAEILAHMNRKPEKPIQQSGPVSRVWSYATRYGKSMVDLLNLLPESLGKTSPATSGGGRPKDKDEGGAKGARPKDKDEVVGSKGRPSDKDEGTARPKDKDEGDGKAPTKKLTKAALKAHIEKLNGAADAALKTQLLEGLKGSKSVEWALEMLEEAGLPTPS